MAYDAAKPNNAQGRMATILASIRENFAAIVGGLIDLTPLKIGATGTAITAHYSATVVWDPGSVAAGATTSTTVTVTGVAIGDTVAIGMPEGVMGTYDVFYMAWVSAANTVRIRIYNFSAAAVDAASATFRVDVWKH